MNETTGTRARFEKQDVAEIAMGACVMAFPVAVSQEVWDLGQELSLMRVELFAVASVFFLALLIYLLQHRRVPADPKVFLQRVVSTHGVTLMISALLPIGVDRLELMHPLEGLKSIAGCHPPHSLNLAF